MSEIPRFTGVEMELAISGENKQGQEIPVNFLVSWFLRYVREEMSGMRCLIGKDAIPVLSDKAEAERLNRLIEERVKDGHRDIKNFARDWSGIFLSNGLKIYNDMDHPEFSTAGCTDAYQLVAHEKAAERISNLIKHRMPAAYPDLNSKELNIRKLNSDLKGNSFGYHANFLTSPEKWESLTDMNTHYLVKEREQWAGYVVSAVPFQGSGKFGAEDGSDCLFQISQRADFVTRYIGWNTTSDRSIINTREVPAYVDLEKYRRFHVIVFDAKMNERQIYLGVGVPLLILEAIENHALRDPFVLKNPVRAFRLLSRDLDCQTLLELQDNRKMTAFEMQSAYAEDVEKYLDRVGDNDFVKRDVLKKWQEDIDSFSRLNWEDTETVEGLLHYDWVAKLYLAKDFAYKMLCKAFPQERFNPLSLNREDLMKQPRKEGESLFSMLVSLFHLRYHDTDPQISTYYKHIEPNVENIVYPEEIDKAMWEPPQTSRDYFVYLCWKKFGSYLIDRRWDALEFRFKDKVIKIGHLEPVEAGKRHTEEFVNQARNPLELVEALKQAGKIHVIEETGSGIYCVFV